MKKQPLSDDNDCGLIGLDGIRFTGITRVPGGKSPENTVFFLREHRPRTDLDLLSQ